MPACGNRALMHDIIRKEYGFKGYIVSDEGAIENILTGHKYVNTMIEAVALAANAGVDLELPGGEPAYVMLYEAVMKGLVDYETIVERTRMLFYARMRLGLFDPPEMNPYSNINSSVIQSAEHRRLSIVAATKTFVLLKNKNVLPIPEGSVKNLAVSLTQCSA